MNKLEEALEKTKNILFFYKFSCGSKIPELQFDKPYSVLVFSPSFTKLKLHTGRILLYLFWYIFTLGKYCIYYVRTNEGKLIHYSHILPRFFKFPYMKNVDFEIGPCWTHQDYRGQNIYPYVIIRILSEFCKEGREFYMMTDESNLPSRKGIEKAGFSFFSKGLKTGVLGIYRPIAD